MRLMLRDLQFRTIPTKLGAILSFACLMPLPGFGEEPATDSEADTLALLAEVSADAPALHDVNDGTFFVQLRIENTGDHAVVAWPYVSARLVDADGNEVPTSLRIGRWGRRRGDSESLLEEIRFVTLDAGEKHEFDVRLNRCVCDSRFITGWNLSQPGEYRLDLHYVFDRDEVKDSFGKGCRVLDDDREHWNRAIEIDEQVEVSFTVK
jgi:hypothetical protein